MNELTTNINDWTTISSTTKSIYADNTVFHYNWEHILEQCPYEELKKEFRKRNLKKLLE